MTLLRYADIRGKKGVWTMHESSGNKTGRDLFVADGKGNEWHGMEGKGYCCGQRHTQYYYRLTALRVESFREGGKALKDDALLLLLEKQL